MRLCGLRPRLVEGGHQRGRSHQVPACIPHDGVEPISAHAPCGALVTSPTRQGRVACTVIGHVCISFLADTHVPAPAHPQAPLATFDQSPYPGAAGTRLGHVPGHRSVTSPGALGVGTHLGGDHGWGRTPDPRGVRAVAPPGGERTPLGFVLLAILWPARLTRVVAGMPCIDLVRQDGANGRGLPDLMLARRGREVGLVQALGDLPTTAVLFDAQALEAADHRRFLQGNHDLGKTAVAFGQRVVPRAPGGPREQCAPPGFLPAAPARACENLGALLCGHHPLPLGQQLALRRVAKGGLQKHRWDVERLALLDAEPLLGIMAGAPIGRQDDHRSACSPLRRITEPIQPGPIAPRAAEAFVERGVFG